MSSGLKTIGSEAFGSCAFAGCKKFGTVKVPKRTRKIGLYAFQYCRGMKKIYIPKRAKLRGGERSVFFECRKTLKVKYY